MVAYLKLVIDNSPEILAASRRRAADAIVGTRPPDPSPYGPGPARAPGTAPLETLTSPASNLFASTSHLALAAAALAALAPSSAAGQSAPTTGNGAAPQSGASSQEGSAVAPIIVQPVTPDASLAAESQPSPSDAPATSETEPASDDASAAVIGVEGSGQTTSGRSATSGTDGGALARPGSSTSPGFFNSEAAGQAGSAAPGDSGAASNAFFSLDQPTLSQRSAGPSGESAGAPASGSTDGVADFSQALAFSPLREINIKKSASNSGGDAQDSGGQETINQLSKGNGVYVDLSASDGPEISAWQIDASGRASSEIRGVANADSVIGTIGNDIVVGNARANTFIYSAEDDATETSSGASVAGADASYGFDIYSGGRAASGDAGDTLDFSRLGGASGELLPYAAKGIVVDLAQSLTIETIDPITGGAIDVTGSLVSTTGGSEVIDLALIVWAERSVLAGGAGPAEGAAAAVEAALELRATIENVTGSGGTDIVLGNADDNTYTVTGDGSAGASTFDGRGGEDTIDLSRAGTASGIEIHLGDGEDGGGCAAVTAESRIEIAIVTNVENVIGTAHDDIFEGDEAGNTFTGGGGSDTYLYTDIRVEDGQIVLRFGDDVIRDFNRSYGTSGHSAGSGSDRIVFNSLLFDFSGEISNIDKITVLLDRYARDADLGIVIDLDENNSLTLESVYLRDLRDESDGARRVRHEYEDSFYFI